MFLLHNISYGQNPINWGNPLCISEDLGIGGPRYLDTNLPLNKTSLAQNFEFKLRCKGDVAIHVQQLSGTGGVSIFSRRLLEDYLPSEAFFEVNTTVTYLNTNKVQKSTLKVFDIAKSTTDGPMSIKALGPNQIHEFSVRVEIPPKVFNATRIPDPPKIAPPFYAPLFSIAEDGLNSGRSDYGPYPTFLVSTFDDYQDPCVSKPLLVIAPSVVDFGVMNREDLVASVSRDFFFRITRRDEGTCTQPLYPIITFKTTEDIVNDELHLNNGTILSLHDELSYGQIKYNQPMRLGELRSDSLINMKINANLRKNPNKSLRAGEFATTLIYSLEYR